MGETNLEKNYVSQKYVKFKWSKSTNFLLTNVLNYDLSRCVFIFYF